MSEETVTQEKDQTPQEPTPGEPPAIDAEQVRKHKLFLESAKREQALKAELDAIKSAQADAAAEKERKDLEAKGEYEKVVDQLKAENEAAANAHAAELLRMKLDAALMKEGAQNEVFIKGAIASFTGTDKEIAQYVSDLKGNEANAVFFGEAKPAGQKPLAHGAPGSRSTSKTLEERVAAGDIDAINEKLRSL